MDAKILLSNFFETKLIYEQDASQPNPAVIAGCQKILVCKHSYYGFSSHPLHHASRRVFRLRGGIKGVAGTGHQGGGEGAGAGAEGGGDEAGRDVHRNWPGEGSDETGGEGH